MSPNDLIEWAARWKPVVYWLARGLVYAATFTLGAIAVWYGGDPQPEWLRRAVAVVAFAAGPLALVNLNRPAKTKEQA